MEKPVLCEDTNRLSQPSFLYASLGALIFYSGMVECLPDGDLCVPYRGLGMLVIQSNIPQDTGCAAVRLKLRELSVMF